MASDGQAAFAWMVRGLGGLLNMIERELSEQTPITDHWRSELENCCERLDNICDSLPRV